jgi:hypothetical protein
VADENVPAASIDAAPDEAAAPPEMIGDASAKLLEAFNRLQTENETLNAEVTRLKGKKTFDDVRATMAEPYANKVFYFLIGYCVFVGAILLLDGFPCFRFHISDVVLGVIAGSTAVSAIGLVGFVVSGLFGASRQSKADA